ncbi:MAG: hypothetical protein ACE5ES_02465 [Candidatus Nanoarchaeia archaeon]
MKLNQINKWKLLVKALEDGIKEAIQLGIIGAVIGLSINVLLVTVLGMFGGSLYLQIGKAVFTRKDIGRME